jgi:hypothetical protein
MAGALVHALIESLLAARMRVVCATGRIRHSLAGGGMRDGQAEASRKSHRASSPVQHDTALAAYVLSFRNRSGAKLMR